MANRIYLPEELAEEKEVILVDGLCYKRVGPSSIPSDTFSVDDVFESCEQCECDPDPPLPCGSGCCGLNENWGLSDPRYRKAIVSFCARPECGGGAAAGTQFGIYLPPTTSHSWNIYAGEGGPSPILIGTGEFSINAPEVICLDNPGEITTTFRYTVVPPPEVPIRLIIFDNIGSNNDVIDPYDLNTVSITNNYPPGQNSCAGYFRWIFFLQVFTSGAWNTAWHTTITLQYQGC